MKKLILTTVLALSGFTADFENLKLRGSGNYTWYFIDVYDAKLFTNHNGTNLFEEKLCLELKYNRDFEGKDIVKQSESELSDQSVDKDKISKWKPLMLEAFPNVKKGDAIRACYNPSEGISFFHNMKLTKKSEDMDFSKSFLNIWLGENTNDKKLRNNLIGVVNE